MTTRSPGTSWDGTTSWSGRTPPTESSILRGTGGPQKAIGAFNHGLAFWLGHGALPGDRDRAEAIRLFESILALPADKLSAADEHAWGEVARSVKGDPASWQFEPITSGAMHSLVTLYISAGKTTQARSLAQRILDVYPDSHSRSMMEAIVNR